MTGLQGAKRRGSGHAIIDKTTVDNRRSNESIQFAFSPCLTFVLFDKRLAGAHGMICNNTRNLPRERLSLSLLTGIEEGEAVAAIRRK